jgi:hypothetical protein
MSLPQVILARRFGHTNKFSWRARTRGARCRRRNAVFCRGCLAWSRGIALDCAAGRLRGAIRRAGLRLAGRRIDASTALPFGPWLAFAIWLLWLLWLPVTEYSHETSHDPGRALLLTLTGPGLPNRNSAHAGPVCRLPNVVRVMARELDDRAVYAVLEPSLITQTPYQDSAHRALRSVSVDHVVRHTALRQPDAGHL